MYDEKGRKGEREKDGKGEVINIINTQEEREE